MNRPAFSLLLILLLLANQGQGLANAHAGSSAPSSPDHGARPHFHVGGSAAHSHPAGHRHGKHAAGHTHRHKSRVKVSHPSSPTTACAKETSFPAASVPGSDHDSTAVYCDGEQALLHRSSESSLTPSDEVVGLALLWTLHSAGLSGAPESFRGRPPAVRQPTLPLYLRTLSLRL
ncbi:hypothetical protein [Lignipirellula cremea]|uniref:Uncharacterized protein n=1 Tax=Lignipirellula cremea TaxID=2528010 RepID=A0A518DL51_9BACT|nr:hypothetical protein [Lignipirellula cremea]QDU92563.1 hypothetical protein Pla8534_03110 [Lignipirellula cremea]